MNIDDYPSMALSSTVGFDFADCEDFLARLEAEDSNPSSYQSSYLSHSLSPDDPLSSGRGSSPLSSFSPNNDDSMDPNAWVNDAYLFPLEQSNVASNTREFVKTESPYVKAEFQPSQDHSSFPDNISPSYAPASFSNNSLRDNISPSSLSPSSLSPASSASSHLMTPPYRTYGPSPEMYTEPLPLQGQFPQQQQLQMPAIPNPSTEVAAKNLTVSAKRSSPATSTAHNAVRRGPATVRNNAPQDIPEQGAKGGKIIKPKKVCSFKLPGSIFFLFMFIIFVNFCDD